MNAREYPDPPAVALSTGLLGEIVSAVEPETEADPVAVLVDLATSFGNAVGAGPFTVADGAIHPPRLFAVMVGDTALSRKGTSRNVAHAVMTTADQRWSEDRVTSGLSSGEGLIYAVRTEHEEDGGERPTDPRLFVVEAEFARVLAACRREGNTLSHIMRDAWDTGNMRSMVKGNPYRTKGAHVSIVGHITADELRARLGDVEISNGFVNRFLWVQVRRSKMLPEGGNLDRPEITKLGAHLGATITAARKVGRMRRSTAARALWADLYHAWGTDAPRGLLGASVSRPEAQALRLSMIYALADESATIEGGHLEAAADLWRYCRDSAGNLFGGRSGDPHLDRLRDRLQTAGVDGLTKTAIHNLYGRNLASDHLDRLCEALVEEGFAEWTEGHREGRGRPAPVLRVRHDQYERNERNE